MTMTPAFILIGASKTNPGAVLWTDAVCHRFLYDGALPHCPRLLSWHGLSQGYPVWHSKVTRGSSKGVRTCCDINSWRSWSVTFPWCLFWCAGCVDRRSSSSSSSQISTRRPTAARIGPRSMKNLMGSLKCPQGNGCDAGEKEEVAVASHKSLAAPLHLRALRFSRCHYGKETCLQLGLLSCLLPSINHVPGETSHYRAASAIHLSMFWIKGTSP
ncbi:uncharacterized protein LOC135091084 [Scylla paramamosain]|uniref:uncharacterized protein LOC135091084 n=1 Tax=Scylla paramamosain TaxID=85552 RepID=UPI003082FF46